MATTQSHTSDLTSEEQTASLDIMKEQPVSANNETSASLKSSQAAADIVHPDKVAPLTGPYLAGDFAGYLPSNILSPQAQGFYYRGYENSTGEWDEYSSYVNVEGLDITSPVGFNENASLVYQTGYGYNPQMAYGPYSPAASPLPSEGQLYTPHQFPFLGASPYYQQVVPPSMQYITSPTQPELTSLVGVDQQGDNIGPRPSYHPHPIGPFSGNQPNHGFPEWQQSFDGGIWSDWSKPSDMHRHSSSISPALSPQPLGSFGSFGQNITTGSLRQRSLYGFGSGSNSYNRGYMHSGGRDQGFNYGTRLISNVGMGNQGWMGVDNTQGRGRVSDPSLGGGYNGTFDILNEQNRGPRASKLKTQVSEELDPAADSKKNNKGSATEHEESNNSFDFITDYNNAKLFIIKSYSEDNVHKSIKYNVWASTPNGNKKLDAAYREAKDEKEPCPVFLLFSVNASSQFCGVAEMVGPVDFEKSVDYWQQDKWSGQFPVKWHIIKDVPNSQFRHIILENNDNKPVTNSRDTQEVKLEQGIEMLKIFKNYDADTSILDDFEFYEEREKIIQDRKTRRQPSLPSAGVEAGEYESKPASAALPTDFIKNMSKSFAQVVRLDEGSKEAGKASSSPDAITTTAAVSSGQSNYSHWYTSLRSGKKRGSNRNTRNLKGSIVTTNNKKDQKEDAVPGRNACEIHMFHQEDAGLNVEMAMLAFSNGIWSYVCKMENALRKYVATSHRPQGSTLSAVSLMKKIPSELESQTSDTTNSLGTTTSSLHTCEGAKRKKLLRKPSKKLIANGLLLAGGAVCLSRGHSALGAKLAFAYFLSKMRKRGAPLSQTSQDAGHK